MGQLDGPRPDSGRRVWRKCLGAGYFGRLVDFNTNEVRPGRLLVQEGDFGYAVMGLGAGAATILRWLDRPGQGLALDQATFIHPDVPDWVRKLDEPELRRLATLEALAGPEWASEAFWRYNHNHWPAGSPGGVGGEFAPRGSGDGPSLSGRVHAGDGKPRFPAAPELLPVPGYRKEVFNSPAQARAWNDLIAAARVLPGATNTQAYAMAMTFAAEGGMKRAGNGFIAGLSPADIRDAVAALGVQGKPLYPDLANLREAWAPTADQVPEIYRFVMDRNLHTVGGMKALDQIGDPYAAAALFDTFFWSGPSGGARLVQEAIDSVTELAVPIDGKMGPKTLAAYTRLTEKPATRRRLLDALAAMRKLWAEKHHQSDSHRLEFFRFPDQA